MIALIENICNAHSETQKTDALTQHEGTSRWISSDPPGPSASATQCRCGLFSRILSQHRPPTPPQKCACVSHRVPRVTCTSGDCVRRCTIISLPRNTVGNSYCAWKTRINRESSLARWKLWSKVGWGSKWIAVVFLLSKGICNCIFHFQRGSWGQMHTSFLNFFLYLLSF